MAEPAVGPPSISGHEPGPITVQAWGKGEWNGFMQCECGERLHVVSFTSEHQARANTRRAHGRHTKRHVLTLNPWTGPDQGPNND